MVVPVPTGPTGMGPAIMDSLRGDIQRESERERERERGVVSHELVHLMDC